MKSNNRSTTSYYRTLYSKYGVDDAFLQNRAQRRATGAFLERVDIAQSAHRQIIDPRRHRQLKRAFRDTSLFNAVSTAATVSAMVLLLQSTPTHALQTPAQAQPLTEKSIQSQGDTHLALDEDSCHDDNIPQNFLSPSDLLSVHLITDRPQYCPVSFGERQLLIDDDSDVEPLSEKQNVLTVIDTSVEDWELLRAAVTEGEILLLEEDISLDAVIAKMAQMESVDTLNIISHGKPGSILLDDHELSSATLQQDITKWRKIGSMLTRDGDLKLYGCNIGQGREGREFVEKLANITGADVAASVNHTGNSARGGDWNLELVVGELNTNKHVLSKDVRHFPHVLAFSGTLNMSGFTNGYAASRSYTVPTTSYNFRAAVDSTTLYFFSRIYADADGDDSGGNTVTLDFTSGETFNATSVYIYSCASVGDSTDIKITSDKGDTTTSGVLNDKTGATVNLNWTGITKLYFQENNAIPLKCFGIDDLVLTNLQPAPSTDSDGTLTAAGGITEPVDLPTTASSGAPVSVFDFTIADGGTADGLTLDVSQIDLNLSGTSSGNFSKMRFNLSGCATKSAVAPSGSTVSFTSTGISVADGGSTTCTVAAYWQDNTGITDNQTLAISLDGDTDLTVDGAKTQMSGANSAVSTGNMSTTVIATGLSFTTQPAGSVSGVALTTQPVVKAVDAAGNVDTDFTETITLTEASAGTLSGNTQAASSGVATFTSLTYSASADQESFTLTANDQDGVGSDLPTANANAVTSDVVATKLIFATQPSPTSVLSGSATAFSTVPVVNAVNAADIVDTGYSTDIVLSEVNGAGSATMTGTGDNDGNGATVTLTPTSGSATYTGLTVTYTNSGGSAETFNLRASSGGLTTTDSTSITSNVLSITSATYDANSGVLVVTGTGFEAKTGAANDVTVNKITLTGEGGNTYTLTSATNVEIDNSTQFTVTLTGTDKTHADGLFNTNGTQSDDATTYNIAVADDWMANVTAGNTADLTGNGVTVSSVSPPTITSATYDFSTGDLVVTGTRFVSRSGASNDVDVSTLTLTGESGGTYTLTTGDVEITAATSFTVSLNASDMLSVNGLLNKDGVTADGGTTYNLAAADNWMTGAAASTNIQDLTGNGVTVSNYFAPSVTSATYDAGTGVLNVSGTGFVSASGATNDVDVTRLTLTGQASGTRQLTTGNVEVSSDTSFSVTLNSADKTAVNLLLNKNGTSSVDAVTYNLAAADNWMTAAPASQDIADTTGNGITVSNADTVAPTISAVSIPNAAMKVGDVVTVTITVASDSDDYTTGLGGLSGTVGGFALSSLSRTNATTYTAQFTITDGGTDVAAGSNVPVSLTLTDSVGNTSSPFTTPIAQGSDSIDANLPVITSVSVPNVAMKVGDVVTVAITASETGLSLTSGTVNGVAVTSFTDNGGGNYTAAYTIADGGTDRAAGDSIPVAFVVTDASGNSSAAYTTAISQNSDSIDANNPSISNVTIPNAAMKVGDAVTVTITAGEAGLSLSSGTVNGVSVTGFTDNGGGNYSATYTIVNGGTDRAAGDAIPVSFVLADSAGNNGTYTTAISQAGDSIDANIPIISNVTVPDVAMNVGDAVTVTITAGETGLSLGSGTVNGVNVTGFTDNADNTYSATYTIVDGGTDRAAGDSIPVAFVLIDSAGNSSAAYTTAISQGNDSIDANSPSISNVTIPNAAMKVGDAVTVTITASEAGLSLVNGTVNGVSVTGFTDNGGGNYTATYTIVDGGTDRAAGDTIPVSFMLQDGAGNVTATYTTAIAQASDSIDANLPGTASGVLAVDENAGNGTGAGTVTATDADTYSLTDDAGGRFAIDSVSGEVTVANGSLLNFENNTSHNITVRVTDSGGNTADAILAVTINDINDAPTGSVTISGTATEDQTLTAGNTLADEDGLGTISYQWQADGIDISGATGTTYTLGDTEVGAVITVVASYIDGNSFNESMASSATAPVSGINDTPVIANVNGDVVAFAVGGAAIALDDGANATLADADSADFNGGNVTIAIIANRADSEDQLRIGAIGPIATSGSDVTHTDGVTLGTFAGGTGSNNLVITLNANATLTRVRDLLSALQYVNTDSATLNTAARSVSITVDDGDGGASTSASHTVTVNLVLAPTIDLDSDDSSGATDGDFNGTFTEDGGEVAVADTDTAITDDGNTHLTLTVTLTNPLDGTAESLSSTLGTGTQTVAGDVVDIIAYDSGTGELVINVDGTDGDGQLAESTLVTLMESIRYNNTADAPDTTARVITFTATDSDSNTGNAATATLAITAVNDAPAFSNLDGTPAFTEGGTAVVLDSNVTIADAELDATNAYNGATLTLARNGSANAADQFANSGTLSALTEGGSVSLGAAALGTVTTNSGGTLVLTFNASATSAGVNSVMQQLTYNNASDAPASTVQIDWSLSDGNSGSQGTGGALAASGSTTVAITGVNDDPVGTVAISGTATEYQTLTADTSGLSDPDGLGAFSYQWQSGGANVGTDSASYSLVASDIGNTITVTVSYTDAGGTPESVVSTPSAVVANTNDAPAGSVIITGTATEDQPLTADTSGLSDADGLGTFSYQWQRSGVDIGGATGSTYTLSDDDVGNTLTVTVSYTDGHGTAENVTSNATSTIANVNDAPTGTVTVSGTATEDQTLTASHTLADADGLGTVGYQWQRDGVDISDATNATYILTDADVDAAISVVASYTDDHGTVESMASNATGAVANVNDDPTGSVTINGDTTENQTLTATHTLSDADGLGAINYQWHRNGTAISGATGDSYLLTLDDVDATLTVTASYTDGHGTLESVTSGATAVIQIANQLPQVTAPADITVDATGLFTHVDLGQATAIDAEDGDVAASADSDGFFSPGTHTVTWTAVDSEGAQGSATQTVNVIPLVSFSKDQDSAEGSSVTIKVILNGPAVEYPVTVPFTVGGSAFTDDSDHDLTDGEIVIQSPHLEATITVNLLDDGAGEGLETMELTMGTPTNAVTGSVSSHVVDIYEDNVAPEVNLTADQGSGSTRIVGQTDGPVTVTAHVTDPNSGDSHSYDWSATDNALVDTDSVENTFTIDPSGLTPGIYTLAIVVDDGQATAQHRLRLRVEATLPVLTATDSDGDGIDDDLEGIGDSDGDGVPNYLDHAGAARNVVQELQANAQAFLMETEPGLGLTLGQVAFRAHGDRTSVSASDIATHANNGTGAQADDEFHAYNGGLFDFNVSDLPVAGQSVRIVIAQFAAIPANAVYRKQMASGWQDFVEDARNSVASAPGAEGYCPPPGDAAYTNGLTEGHWCVQLTIEDGGPNDADGQINQTIDDPGGVAEQLPQATDVTVSGSGGGALGLWSIVLLTLLAMFRLHRGRRLLISLLLLGSAATTHAQSEWVPDYIGLSYLAASSNERDSDFSRELNDLGLDARVRQSDLDRNGFALHAGYALPDNVRIEIGYADLGDVSTKISGTAIDVDNFIDSVSGVYPVTASGWTLSLGRTWRLHDRVDLLTTLGAFIWSAEYELKSANTRRGFDEDGVGAQLFVGVDVKTLENIPVRLGWRGFRFDNTEVGAWELGMGYWF